MGGLHNAFDRAETRRRRARILFHDEGGTFTRSKLLRLKYNTTAGMTLFLIQSDGDTEAGTTRSLHWS
jgi:hypothetical protein